MPIFKSLAPKMPNHSMLNRIINLESQLTHLKNKTNNLEYRLTIGEKKIKRLEKYGAEPDQTINIVNCGGEYSEGNPVYTFEQESINYLCLTISVKGHDDGGNIKFKDTGYSIVAQIYDEDRSLLFNESFKFEDPASYINLYTTDQEKMATVQLKINAAYWGLRNSKIYGKFSIPMMYVNKDDNEKKIVYTVNTNDVLPCSNNVCCPLLSLS